MPLERGKFIMSFTTEAAKFGRIPTIFVECDMDFCANVYGNAPCTAVVGVTGAAKCYNTYATCQDKPHFVKTTKTYRFCDQNADLPVGISAIPLLKSVSFASQEITPGKGLGVRGSVSVRLIDAPFPDTEIDPYWRERTYDTNNQGTFWGKFKARNPFYENRVLRVRRGYLTEDGFSWSNFVDSVYVIEQLQGIAKDDSVKIVAKDILKLADDKKALFPKPSNGRLAADITATDTAFTLKPVGVGAEYPAIGKLAISGDMMAYTRIGDVFTVTRNVSNTLAEAHKADDTVQSVGIFDHEKIQDVIYSLLTTDTGISTSYINKAAWDVEANAHLAGVWSAEIPEPTGINSLIGELTEQGTCRIWWDEIEQNIPFRAIKPLPNGLPILSDSHHFLTKTIDVKTDTNQRISTVLIYFGQKKPTEKVDEQKNYELRVATPNLEAISDLEYGSNSIKKIYSRWFKKTSSGRANALADALLKTYRDPPQQIEFSLTPALQLKVGDLFYAQTRKIQDVTGAIATVPMEVVYAQPTDKDDIKYKAQQVSTAIPLSNTRPVNFQSDELSGVNLYDAYVDSWGVPESGITAIFTVYEDVLITGATTADYALVNDNRWPVGVTLILINHGVIAGRGGIGGHGTDIYSGYHPPTDTPGTKGGNGLFIESPLTIDNSDGVIAAGGGGGGGGGYTINAVEANTSGGGGGGGAPIGVGGTSGEYVGNFVADGATAGSTTGGAGADGVSGASDFGNGDGHNSRGGKGGNLNEDGEHGFGYANSDSDGSPGGSKGDYAVTGDAFVTWTATGSILGAII